MQRDPLLPVYLLDHVDARLVEPRVVPGQDCCHRGHDAQATLQHEGELAAIQGIGAHADRKAIQHRVALAVGLFGGRDAHRHQLLVVDRHSTPRDPRLGPSLESLLAVEAELFRPRRRGNRSSSPGRGSRSSWMDVRPLIVCHRSLLLVPTLARFYPCSRRTTRPSDRSTSLR